MRDTKRLADKAELLKARYAGMDMYLLSKAQNPGKYGVQLTKEARRMIEDAPDKTDKRSKARERRLTVRMSQETLEGLESVKQRLGYASLQEVVEKAIAEYLDVAAEGKNG